MHEAFARQLAVHLDEAERSLRRVAAQAGLPHQTLHNWLRGVRPRWHRGLPGDIQRLGLALGLGDGEIERLLVLAGCLPARVMRRYTQEDQMQTLPTLPAGWMLAGSHPSHYTLGLDDTITYQGARAATIRANEAAEGFSTLMQQFKADAYRGQRLRLAAAVRAEAVERWAGLWMRIDGPCEEVLAFDNMQQRAIQGTVDWSQHYVVLDVPEQGEVISIGLLLDGPGQVWIAGVVVEVVGPEVATTPHHGLPDHPVNLAFAAEE